MLGAAVTLLPGLLQGLRVGAPESGGLWRLVLHPAHSVHLQAIHTTCCEECHALRQAQPTAARVRSCLRSVCKHLAACDCSWAKAVLSATYWGSICYT